MQISNPNNLRPRSKNNIMGAQRLSEAKLLFLAFPVLAIIIVSGCTAGNTVSGNGVSVKEFSPDFSEVYSGEQVTFRLLLKNEGSVDAKGVHAELLGLDEDWCNKDGSQCGSSAGGRLENWPNEAECVYGGTGFTMIAPNPLQGTSGDSHACTWTYTAPPLSKGFTITYTPIVRVFYPYKSGVTKLITFGSSAEMRRIQDSGGKLPAETAASTSSPVQLAIETKGPIRFSGDRVAFPLEITITNVGSGAPCSTGAANQDSMQEACKATVSGEDAKNKVTLKVTLDKQMKIMDQECQALTSGKTISLYKGQNALVCDIEASGLTDAPTQKTLQAEAFYEYFTDTSSSVKVTGRREPGS